METRVIFFTGGVYSSLGKGLTLANVGRILKELGFRVSALKLDPYLNLDSGSLSPLQHGEVYVTADGHQGDLDLGHYERFLDREISNLSCVTGGRIYQRLLAKRGHTGETIQVVPHLIGEVQAAIHDLLKAEPDSDFLLVEIGGTVGDMEHLPFIEAASSFGHSYGREKVLFIHIAPILYLETTKEYKTKPTQHSLRALLSHGINPEILILRAPGPIPVQVKEKLSKATSLATRDIFLCPDCKCIYLIAEGLYRQSLHTRILEKLGIPHPGGSLDSWREKTMGIFAPKKYTSRIALVGKYSTNPDSYMSIAESLKMAAYELEIEMTIEYLDVEAIADYSVLGDYTGVCVPHGFGIRGSREKMEVIRHCRENGIPFLGICFGMQLACLEYARNVLGRTQMDSAELDPSASQLLFIPFTDGAMRVGNRAVWLTRETKAFELYGKEKVFGRHRHRFHFNPAYVPIFSDGDFIISGISADREQFPETIELKNHPFFMATQFHPEFGTVFGRPCPLFSAFLRAGMVPCSTSQ